MGRRFAPSAFILRAEAVRPGKRASLPRKANEKIDVIPIAETPQLPPSLLHALTPPSRNARAGDGRDLCCFSAWRQRCPSSTLLFLLRWWAPVAVGIAGDAGRRRVCAGRLPSKPAAAIHGSVAISERPTEFTGEKGKDRVGSEAKQSICVGILVGRGMTHTAMFVVVVLIAFVVIIADSRLILPAFSARSATPRPSRRMRVAQTLQCVEPPSAVWRSMGIVNDRT